MTIAEACALYQEAFPDDGIKLSIFKSLHPDEVSFRSNMPHNVCVCQYHENINLLLQGLSNIDTIPSNHRNLLEMVCCDVEDEECMFSRCQICEEKISTEFLTNHVDDDELTENVKWYQWVQSDGKTEKVQISGTVSGVLQSLADKLKAFKVHSFIKTKQAAQFQSMYTAPRPGHAVLQIDFSENASIMEQDEVQSAHWGHTHVTVFTAVAWSLEGSRSFCIISDTSSHDKHTAASFLNTLMDDMQTQMTSPLVDLDIFSDGAAQHFKQKYMFLFLSSLLDKKGIRANCHFFATSHGKGAVDGVGGTVKRAVFNAIKSRRYHVVKKLARRLRWRVRPR